MSEQPFDAADAAPGQVLAAAAPIEWRFNPWRERPRAATIAAVASVAIAAVLFALDEHPILEFVLACAEIAALSPLFMPARCRLDAEGVARRDPWGWEKRTWAQVRRGVIRPGHVLVSPFERPNWLDPYRALVLPLPRADQVLRATVTAHLASHGL